MGCRRDAVESSSSSSTCIVRLQITRRRCTFLLGPQTQTVVLLPSSPKFLIGQTRVYLRALLERESSGSGFTSSSHSSNMSGGGLCAPLRHPCCMLIRFHAALPFPHACHGTPEVRTSPLTQEESRTPCAVIDHQSAKER